MIFMKGGGMLKGAKHYFSMFGMLLFSANASLGTYYAAMTQLLRQERKMPRTESIALLATVRNRSQQYQ